MGPDEVDLVKAELFATDKRKNRNSLVAPDWDELEALAGASASGLRHNVHHKN